MKEIETTDTDLNDYINFSLPDYMFIPKGFEIIFKNEHFYYENGNRIFTPWIKTYSNNNGKIIKKIDNVNFDDPFFENFSQKEKDDFLKHHEEIMDFNFYIKYFCWFDDNDEFIREKYEKMYKYLSNFKITSYNFDDITYVFKKNGKILDHSPYKYILRNPSYYDVNPNVLKYLDIPKDVILTLKFQYENDNEEYNDVLPWKKTYSNPDGNKIIMKYHDVDFDHPIFENFSDTDICLFFNYYMTMLDHYFFDIYDYKTCSKKEIFLFEFYIKKYLDIEMFDLEQDLSLNDLPYKKLWKRKEKPDICYSCSKRKIKNNECIYLGFI